MYVHSVKKWYFESTSGYVYFDNLCNHVLTLLVALDALSKCPLADQPGMHAGSEGGKGAEGWMAVGGWWGKESYSEIVHILLSS